ncbi:MAG: hypothetical protein FJ033_04375 [Chloroflexi bacterium]|nr:hypothetical protein [Chloroflexota bacterium]
MAVLGVGLGVGLWFDLSFGTRPFGTLVGSGIAMHGALFIVYWCVVRAIGRVDEGGNARVVEAVQGADTNG